MMTCTALVLPLPEAEGVGNFRPCLGHYGR